MGEGERRGYWQQQHDDARPPRVILWCGAHRWLVRGIGVVVLVVVVVLLVLAVTGGDSLVGPIFSLLAWALQGALWGFFYPRQADRWSARQAAVPAA